MDTWLPPSRSLTVPLFGLSALSPYARLRALFADAVAARHARDYASAAALFEEAIDLAIRLDAREFFGSLAAGLSKAYYCMQRFGLAAAGAHLGLLAQSSLRSDHYSPRLALDIELHHRFGICQLYLGNFAVANAHLLSAQRLLNRQPSPPADALPANIAWDLAISRYLQGDFQQAVDNAERALGLLAGVGTPEARARLRLLLVNIMLDSIDSPLADHLLSTRDATIGQAQVHLERALEGLIQAGDAVGQDLALLVYPRLARLTGQAHDWFTTLETVGHTAENRRDQILLGKAYVALATEFAARGEVERALNCLRRALGVLESSQAPAESIPVWSTLELMVQSLGQ